MFVAINHIFKIVRDSVVIPVCFCVFLILFSSFVILTIIQIKTHLHIRAFHVAGRCTDCGECSRVCPQGIPLHLFNRKFIKDIDELYGEYQAGEDTDSKGPLTNFTFDDAEPSIVTERG